MNIIDGSVEKLWEPAAKATGARPGLGFKGLAVAGNPSLTAHSITAHTAMTRMSISR
jgi:hypothetical protein